MCRETCSTLTSKRVVTCIDDEFCPHKRICEGSVTDCEYGGGQMQICEKVRSIDLIINYDNLLAINLYC